MFKFSKRSLDNLCGVHPLLVAVVKEALAISDIDFGVTEGLRTIERQKHLVEKKLSQTMNSKHLKQADGWGHAVDLVPYIGEKISWQWSDIFIMASAIQSIIGPDKYPKIRWGGAWTLLNVNRSPRDLQEGYKEYCRHAKKKPFLDGPHFEIIDPGQL